MSRTLWIGDVQDNWTEDYLCALMRNAINRYLYLLIELEGLVSIKLMRDRSTNEPQGLFFVEMLICPRIWFYRLCNRRRCD